MFLFIFSTTHTGKGHESQICLSVRIDYTFLPSTKSEGRGTENLLHVWLRWKY